MRVDTTFLSPSVFRLCQLVSQWRVAVTECSAMMAVVFWCGVGVGVGVGVCVGVDDVDVVVAVVVVVAAAVVFAVVFAVAAVVVLLLLLVVVVVMVYYTVYYSVLVIKGSLGGETSVLRTFRMSGKELVKERVSKERVRQGKS